MRLISADSIMRKMADMLNESGHPQLAEKAIALIDHEPTAFDKEWVLDELKQNEKFHKKQQTEEDNCIAQAYAKAIKVVETGELQDEYERNEIMRHWE